MKLSVRIQAGVKFLKNNKNKDFIVLNICVKNKHIR